MIWRGVLQLDVPGWMPRWCVLPAIAALALTALLSAPRADGAELRIYATTYPLAYFAERITGRPDWVVFPAIAGDPAEWRPAIEDILAMQTADVILMNGAGYERWAAFATLPPSRIVVTSDGFADRLLQVEGGTSHRHGPEGDHAHRETAFTTWIDFSLATRQAEAVKDAIVSLGALDETEVVAIFATLRDELLALDGDLQGSGDGGLDLPLVASHPVYDYLAARYGLNILSVHWEPDVVPTDEMWAGLAFLLERHPARSMIWEAVPAAASVRRLEEMGVGSVVFDPSGNRPSGGDFMTVMRQNVERLRAVLERDGAL